MHYLRKYITKVKPGETNDDAVSRVFFDTEELDIHDWREEGPGRWSDVVPAYYSGKTNKEKFLETVENGLASNTEDYNEHIAMLNNFANWDELMESLKTDKARDDMAMYILSCLIESKRCIPNTSSYLMFVGDYGSVTHGIPEDIKEDINNYPENYICVFADEHF